MTAEKPEQPISSEILQETERLKVPNEEAEVVSVSSMSESAAEKEAAIKNVLARLGAHEAETGEKIKDEKSGLIEQLTQFQTVFNMTNVEVSDLSSYLDSFNRRVTLLVDFLSSVRDLSLQKHMQVVVEDLKAVAIAGEKAKIAKGWFKFLRGPSNRQEFADKVDSAKHIVKRVIAELSK